MKSIGRWESQDSERLSGLPKVTQLVGAEQDLEPIPEASADARTIQGLSWLSQPVVFMVISYGCKWGNAEKRNRAFPFLLYFCLLVLGPVEYKAAQVLLPCKVYLVSNDTISSSLSLSKWLASFNPGPGVWRFLGGIKGSPSSLNYLPSFDSALLSLKRAPQGTVSLVLSSANILESGFCLPVPIYRNISTPCLVFPEIPDFPGQEY